MLPTTPSFTVTASPELLSDACALSEAALLEPPQAVRDRARVAADKDSAMILLSFIGITSVYDVNFLID